MTQLKGSIRTPTESYQVQIDLFCDVIERLAKEGRESIIDNGDGTRPLMSVAHLARLETAKRFLN
jgi:hypothetical protein